MVFTKDNLSVMVTCFTEKGWAGTLNLLDYSTWDILQELVYEGRLGPFANLRDLQNDQTSTKQREKLFCSGKGIWLQ